MRHYSPKRKAAKKSEHADLVILDPATFRAQSTFEKPAVPSIGVRFLLVNGTLVIDGGAIVAIPDSPRSAHSKVVRMVIQ